MNFFKRLGSQTAIVFDGNEALCKKGSLRGRQLVQVENVLKRAHLESGEIWIGADGRITFSKDIPKRVHQGVRNCL